MAVVAGVVAPSQAVLDAVAGLLSVLPPHAPHTVRLMMALLDMRVALKFAVQHRVDLVATQERLPLEPGRVVTSGVADNTWGDGFWQWYRVAPIGAGPRTGRSTRSPPGSAPSPHTSGTQPCRARGSGACPRG
ncbi:hypothetical protein [Streptomyces sp. NPDC048527]|uniref:hypothetical protein n=1 Tax=Streptomyces sp. NPDC048527 TaxID=3365568 RepID=UPI003716D05F